VSGELAATAPVLQHTVRYGDLIRYAGASGDFYPLHTDDAYARAAGLPGVFAHGMYSAGLLATAVTTWCGVESLRRFAVRFVAKTWPGETLVSRIVVTAGDTSVPGAVEFECDLRNDDGEIKVAGTGTVGPGPGAVAPAQAAPAGRRCGSQVVTVDRAVVSNLATVLQDGNALYRDARVAEKHGFADIPAPPTYAFVMTHWGTRPELTEEFGGEPVPPNPLDRNLEQLGHIGHVMAELMTERGPGLVLHAEQEFLYHRPLVVGDVVRGESAVTSTYQRKDKTFVVIETVWTDVRTATPVVTARFTAVHLPARPDVPAEGNPS
jgi:acyl dehydratase